MASNRTVKYKQLFDRYFNVIENTNGQSIYVVKEAKALIISANDYRDVSSKYTIFCGDKTVEFEQEHLQQMLRRTDKLDAQEIFDKTVTRNPGKSKVSLIPTKYNVLSTIFLGIAIVVAVGLVAQIISATTDKYYGKTVTDLTFNKDIKIGDYVRFNAEVWDSFGVEVTHTRSKYGIELSKTTEKGNTYLLVTRPLVDLVEIEAVGTTEIETYIFRFASNSDYEKAFYALAEDEYILNNLKGEVKTLDKIEKLDDDEQIESYFVSQIAENFRDDSMIMKNPVYLIDGRVVQADLDQAIILTVGIGAIAIIFGTLGAIVLIKRKAYIKSTVDAVYNSGPTIKK